MMTSLTSYYYPDLKKKGYWTPTVGLARQLVFRERARTYIYNDGGGNDTVGIGHRITEREKRTDSLSIGGKSVRLSTVARSRVSDKRHLTTTEIEILFLQDLRQKTIALNRLIEPVRARITQAEFDVLLFFAYNAGEGNLRKASFFKALLRGASRKQVAELWRSAVSTSKGRKLHELVDRRIDEANAYLTGNLDLLGQDKR